MDEEIQAKLEDLAREMTVGEGGIQIDEGGDPVMLQRSTTDKFLAIVMLELQKELKATNRLVSQLLDDDRENSQ